MTRALRRHHESRIKARTRAKLRRWTQFSSRDRTARDLHPTPAMVGIYAATHATCSCWMCTGPAKWRKPETRHIDDWSVA